MPQEPQPFPPIGELLQRKGIWLEKRKSQHFLRRQEVCRDIAELVEIGSDDLVIEVGAGLGNLTVELAHRAGRVVSVELDRAFEEWHDYLRATYASLEFLYRDFLDVDLEALVAEKKLGGRIYGIGNLPYQITSDILFRFVDAETTFHGLAFMIQKEVAERIASGPATRQAGALTYKIALRYKAEIALSIGPGGFLPPPKVDSSVIVLTPLTQPMFRSPAERRFIYTVLDRIFMYRRKTLANCLMQGGLVRDRVRAEAALERAGIVAQRRPETLSLEEVLSLARALPESTSAHA